MIRVLWMSRYGRTAPSSRFRVYGVARELANRNVGSRVVPLVGTPRGIGSRVWAAWNASSADVVVLQKSVLVPPVGVLRLRTDSPLVLDVDDAMWLSDRRWISSEARTLARRVDHVVAANEQLADWYESQGAKRISIIRTSPDGVWDKAPELANPQLCWIGSPSTSVELRRVAGLLRGVGENSSTQVVLIGCAADVVEDVDGRNIVTRDWSITSEMETLRTSTIGVCFKGNDEWARFKSGFKTMLYLARGVLPLVESAPAHQPYTEAGAPTFTDDRSLAELIARWTRTSHAERSAKVDELQAGLAAEYSREAVGARWMELLEQLR